MSMDYEGGHENFSTEVSKQIQNTMLLSHDRDIAEGAQQQLSHIGTCIEEILSDEADCVNDDLGRIRSLIHDSMEILQASFSQVMMKTVEQGALIDELVECLSASAVSSREKEQAILMHLSDASQGVKQEMDQSIRALQFEDITCQLVEHIGKRIVHVNEVALMTHGAISNATVESDLKMVADRLQVMRDEFRQMNISDIVKQQNMSEGDIELF